MSSQFLVAECPARDFFDLALRLIKGTFDAIFILAVSSLLLPEGTRRDRLRSPTGREPFSQRNILFAGTAGGDHASEHHMPDDP